MASIISPITKMKRGSYNTRFNWNYFLLDNVTGSRWLMVWIGILTVVTLAVAVGQIGSAPGRAWIIIGIWAALIAIMAIGELFNLHNPVSRWLKDNMYSSLSNVLVTLLVTLLVGQVVASLWTWGVVNATVNPELTEPEFRNPGGATWGVVWGARKLLLTGLLGPEHNWRVVMATAMVLILWLLTFLTGRPALEGSFGRIKSYVNYLWLLSPFAAYIFLAGLEYDPLAPFLNIGTLIRGVVTLLVIMAVLYFFKVIRLTPVSIAAWVLAWPIAYVVWRLIAQTQIFPPINVDDWGGLLLTVIFAIFVTLLSFPIGVALALGRRAEVQGIPVWIIWPVAIIATLYFLATSTPELWTTSRNAIESALALWPLLIPVAAYYFHKSFDGNVVQAFSVLSIELIRGVPLITLLFMAIVMAPFFTAGGGGVKNFWSVIIGYTIFSAAYMAELVRGGLQAIPRGQYEAADSLGLNTLQKYRFIVLPQALRILIPPLAGAVIGTFKSSSLVALVGMIDLVGVTRAIIGNPQWLGLRTELYAFMLVLYFVVSSVVSWYSRRLEERTGLGVR